MKSSKKATVTKILVCNAIWQVLFQIAFGPVALSQTYKDIYDFTGGSLAVPGNVRLAQGREGYLYGTATGLPTVGGSLYSISTNQNFTLLYTLTNQTGATPNGGLTLATDGNYYGTDAVGGDFGYGTLFRLSRQGVYTILHSFAGGSDGSTPGAPPIQGADGAFYGTTFGDSKTTSTAYKYAPTTGLVTIYQFDQAHGTSVAAPVLQATDGTLYGSALFGGVNDCGALFQLNTSGKLLWSYSFACGSFGALNPDYLVQATDGNLYGTTQSGGTVFGTVFKVDPRHAVTTLHTFEGNAAGQDPIGGLVQASDGNLYGSTEGGGVDGQGVLYRLSPDGSFAVLYSFGSLTGRNPFAPPIQHTNGKFYGTAEAGGKNGFGALFSFDMGLAPFCTFVRQIGKVGSIAQILGQGFKGATGVTFNGVPAVTLQVVSDTYITAMVPVGATTGPVVISTVAGPLASNKNFTVR